MLNSEHLTCKVRLYLLSPLLNLLYLLSVVEFVRNWICKMKVFDRSLAAVLLQ